MTDKEFIMDLLETEKNLTVNMVYALNEASNDSLYKELFEMFKEISKTTKDLFTFAYNKGFYQLEAEQTKKIKDAIKTLSQELELCMDNE